MKLDRFSDPIIDSWLASVPEDRYEALYDAIVAIIDGTWHADYEHWDYLPRPGCIAMPFNEEEVLVWTVFPEFPGDIRIIYIGKPDY